MNEHSALQNKLRSRTETVISGETENLPHLLALAVALARLTALRAATIEPTTQKLISKIRAPKHKPPINSTVLSSMRTSLRSSAGS